MSRATAVVAPSNWLETFGLVVVEAMAAAVPAVAPAHGAFTELIRDGVTGLLHRPGDPGSLAAALRRIVDPELNAAMGAAARRCYQHRFSPEVGLAALIAGYEAAICAARLG
jgi:glycosyltransferase involved in cell wall biosynthesis